MGARLRPGTEWFVTQRPYRNLIGPDLRIRGVNLDSGSRWYPEGGSQLFMPYIFLAAAAGLLGAFVLWALGRPLQRWRRRAIALLLIAPIPFGVFGFLASGEPGAFHWIWRIAYSAMVLGCLAGILRLSCPKRTDSRE